jgi:DNA-binding transcriptional ArsR family regulator
MASEYDTLIYRARVLASATRIEVWSCVGEHGMYAGDVARTLGLAPSTVTHHMRILEHAGLVQCVKQGRCRLYRCTDESWGVLTGAELAAMIEGSA